MKPTIAIIVLLLLMSAIAGADTNSTSLVVVDSADYGDTNFYMRIEEIERNANTSKLKLTYKEMGTSVGSSLFITRGFYEVAKSRGVEYFILLKEGDEPSGGYFYIGGFTRTRNADIQKEFGEEYALTNDHGQSKSYMSVSELGLLFERGATLSEEERAAEAHRRRIHGGEITAATNQVERFEALCAAIRKAKRSKGPKDARALAEELKVLAPQFKDKSLYGNAVQDVNQILGRIALAEGNIEEAKQCLLASADSDGSPTMNSFGPNMTLAKELLLKGEKDTVLQYFDMCRVFWKRHGATLDQWTEDVKAGRTPNFGANLYY